MSGKRYDNVSDSSSDDDYHRQCENSDESCGKFVDYDNDCKIRKKIETSSSSMDMSVKRGRGRSKRPCMNKNAQAARENRIRKKKHLEQVENRLSFYQQKNKSLVNVIQKQDIDIKKLKGEVSYLRCILKNNTNITALLQSMNDGLNRTSQPPANGRDTRSGNKFYEAKSTHELIAINKNPTPTNQRLLQSIVHNQISGKNLPSLPHSELDHTYTIPKIRSAGKRSFNHDEGDENLENCRNSVFDNDSLSGFDREMSTTSPLSHSDKVINVNLSDTEMDEWSGLNVNIYDNFTNFDEMLSPSDDLMNLTNLCDDSSILEQYRDAGICLHINSEKVSLEYCSICHRNSLNSMPE